MLSSLFSGSFHLFAHESLLSVCFQLCYSLQYYSRLSIQSFKVILIIYLSEKAHQRWWSERFVRWQKISSVCVNRYIDSLANKFHVKFGNFKSLFVIREKIDSARLHKYLTLRITNIVARCKRFWKILGSSLEDHCLAIKC